MNEGSSDKDLQIESGKDEQPDQKTSAHQTKNTPMSMKKSAKDMDLKKFSLGSATLGWCIFLMILCILISLCSPDNELVKNGFETFKLIVMTILGYIFGSNNTKSQ